MITVMSFNLKVATWNIAGARKVRSLESFDYEDEDTDYFADRLIELAPDMIFLQESHTSANRVIAKEIADKLGFAHVYNFEVSPSHIDGDYRLGNAVISNIKLEYVKDITFPFPSFGMTFANGSPARRHDKKANIFRYKNLTLVNAQMLPVTVFGKSYTTDEGLELAGQIEDLMLDELTTPLILCGDFNFDKPKKIYPNLYSKLILKESLPDTLTRPNKDNIKETPDHIVISDKVSSIDSGVIEVDTDHYLCWAELSIED